MKIALDIMGGDYAPSEAIKGVKEFLEQNHDSAIHLLLIGDAQYAASELATLDEHKHRFTIIESKEVIGMHESPTKALKEKPDSSIAMGFGLMQYGKADAFISAGNTGAMMVGAVYSVKTIEGILRPTIISPIPRTDGSYSILLDAGANSDCKPEHLVQFAQLGALYAQRVWNVANPTVGLLNIGEEEGKGNKLAQTVYPLLRENSQINFIGNLEGRDMFIGKADVIVCDGFTGNVALKMAESFYNIFTDRGVKDEFLEHFNFEIYGGTPVLGINSPVIIGHGISHATAFKNMIEVAAKIVAADLITVFKDRFAQVASATD